MAKNTFEVPCKLCDRPPTLHVEDLVRGRRVRCPSCGGEHELKFDGPDLPGVKKQIARQLKLPRNCSRRRGGRRHPGELTSRLMTAAHVNEQDRNRRAFARELAEDLERRLDEIVRSGRDCGCRHGELRAIVARLRKIAGQE